MKNSKSLVTLVLAVVFFSSCGSQKTLPVSNVTTEECAVLGFQYGTNVSAEEAKDIADIFRVNFHPSKYNVTAAERVDKELEVRRYKNKKLTKHQLCELGRSLGVKYVVFGSVNKLMDEFSVDVQVIDVMKETTIAFEGNAFQKQDYSKEVSSIARKLASKVE